MTDIHSGNFFKSYKFNSNDREINKQFNEFMTNLDNIVTSVNPTLDINSIRRELRSKLTNAVKFIKDNITIDSSVNLFDPTDLYAKLFKYLGEDPRNQLTLDTAQDPKLVFNQLLENLKDRINNYITDTGLKLLGLTYDDNLLMQFFKEITMDQSSLDSKFRTFKSNIIKSFVITITDSKKLIESNFGPELFEEFISEAEKTKNNFSLPDTSDTYNLLSFTFFDIFYRWVKNDGDISIFFSNHDNLVFIYTNLSLIFLQIVTNKNFISKVNLQKDTLNRFYLQFYNKYKQVYTHLKIRQENRGRYYSIKKVKKRVKITAKHKEKNVTHIFGNFDNIFTKDFSNDDITRRLTSGGINIIEQLKKNPICIIGLGQSGSGKTSTLIQLRLEDRVENGILLNLLEVINSASDIRLSNLEVTVTELRLNSQGYKINNKSEFLEDKSRFIEQDTRNTITVDSTNLTQLGQLIVEQLDQANRKQLPTSNNIQSSRSHVVIKINFVGTTLKPLYICDLAGVENEFNCQDSSEIYRILLAFKQTKLDINNLGSEEITFEEWEKKYIKKHVESIERVQDFNKESSFKIERFFLKSTNIESSAYNQHNFKNSFNNLCRKLRMSISNRGDYETNKNSFTAFYNKLKSYCERRKKEGYLINTTLNELNKDIIKLVKFDGAKKPFFFDNLIDEDCRNNYNKINYFKLMSNNLSFDNSSGNIFNVLDAGDRNNLKIHILTVVNNNSTNIQKVKYKYGLNTLKYKKLSSQSLASTQLSGIENLISNNSQTLLGSIEIMEQLGNFAFNYISCIKNTDNQYINKYLKYKKKYLELKKILKK